MKKTIGIIIFSFIFLSLNAQTIYQNGVAREINSNKKPLVSVFIKFLNSNSTVSGDDGKFQLAFKNQKKGGDIFLEEIKKSGYELVNEKDFENIKISSDSLLGVNVILAQLGYVDAAKKEYYGVSDQALLAGFEKEKKALQAKFQATQLTGTELRTELNSLRKQYEEQKESLDALAERFARINFDDVEPTYKEALELFKAGKINKAIATLEATNPAARTHQIIAEEKRLDTAQKDLDQQKAKLLTDKKKQIAAVRLLADMYSIQFNPLKAEQQYDDLLLLDSTDLEILIDASEFYKDQHRYDKAKKIFSKIINHPQVEPWQVANIHWYTGNIYFNTGDPAKALEAYTLFSKSHKKLVKENPNHSFYKEKLAISYSKLGESHSALGNMEKAFKYIEYATILFEKLYQTYPNNVEFKDGLAITYEKLGSVHSTRGDLDKAFNYYEKYNNLEKQLFKEYPNNVQFKNGLAISYEKLGSIQSDLGNLDTAIKYFEKYNNLEKQLFEEYPNKIEFKNNLAISYQFLGGTHIALENLDKAIIYLEQFNHLEKQLFKEYPNNVEFKNWLAISYQFLGGTHLKLGNLDKALNYFEQFNNIEKQLFKEYPNNVRFKNLLAISYQFLGYTHSDLGNLDKTLDYFEQFNHLEKQLFEEYPNNIEIKNWLAISYSLLARFHRDQKKDYKKAKEYFNQCYLIWKELSQTYPSYIEFKDNYTLASDALTELESLSNPITHLKFQIKAETDTINLYQLYTALCDTLRIYSQKDSDYQTDFVQALNSRAWYGFFLKKFKAVESDIREGMALDTNNKYLFTNLPPALLLQGKYDEALVEYQKYKDVSYGDQNLATYKDAFLDDLNAFEATGIIPPERMEGVKKIRDILNRK